MGGERRGGSRTSRSFTTYKCFEYNGFVDSNSGSRYLPSTQQIMEVFEFKKSLLVRHQEASHVLGVRNDTIPAAMVQKEWSLFLEIAMEPSGWQALWRVPRAVCQELSTKFPTVVMGTVEKVLFDELKAILVVEAVESDDLHLPEKQLVSLCELWPLKHQKNKFLNVARTADCIDQLRFFYQHVWMPWDYDDDDDRDWAKKHLDSRIKFYCDLKNRTMPKRVNSHVLTLLDEANQLQQKRELIALHMDDEEGIESESKDCPTSDLLKIRLRLQTIGSEFETLQFFAPEMRELYEQVRFPKETYYSEKTESTSKARDLELPAYVVTHVGSLEEQIDYMERTKQFIGKLRPVRICHSLQDALDRSESADRIYVPRGRHEIKVCGDLSAGGSIEAFEEHRNQAVICSRQDYNALLIFTGDYSLENITLDCSNVQTGILIKRGNITLKNCCIIGDPKDVSSTGILICGNASLLLENCRVQNFSTGISANVDCCSIQLHTKTIVQECFEGIRLVEGCLLGVSSSKIANCTNYGAVLEVEDGAQREAIRCYRDHRLLPSRKEFAIGSDCLFENNGCGDFAIVNMLEEMNLGQ